MASRGLADPIDDIEFYVAYDGGMQTDLGSFVQENDRVYPCWDGDSLLIGAYPQHGAWNVGCGNDSYQIYMGWGDSFASALAASGDMLVAIPMDFSGGGIQGAWQPTEAGYWAIDVALDLSPVDASGCYAIATQCLVLAIDLNSHTTSTACGSSSRTRLGIGEPDTISVTTTPSGVSLGWYATGAGSASGSGTSATFTASMSPGTASVYVMANYKEPVEDDVDLVDFTVLAPDGIVDVSKDTDIGLGPEVDTGNVGGARTSFDALLSPLDVDFSHAAMQEHITDQTATFPDGNTHNIVSAADLPFHVNCGTGLLDTIGWARPVAWLQNGGVYSNWSATNNWVDQYKDATGNWVTFKSMNVVISLEPTNEGGPAKIRVIYLGVPGGLQGPYQLP